MTGADTRWSGLCRRADRGRPEQGAGETLRRDWRARHVPRRLLSPVQPSADGGGVGENARKCDRVRYLRPSQDTADGINMMLSDIECGQRGFLSEEGEEATASTGRQAALRRLADAPAAAMNVHRPISSQIFDAVTQKTSAIVVGWVCR